MPHPTQHHSDQDQSHTSAVEQIAEIFARGVCRFWKQRHSRPVEQEDDNSADIPLKQLAIHTKNRPCVHSKTAPQRRIYDE